MVRIGGGRAAQGQAAPAEVVVPAVGRRQRARPVDERQRGGVHRARYSAGHGWAVGDSRHVDRDHGPTDLDAGSGVTDRRPGGAPRWRGRGRQSVCRARHCDGAQLVRQQAARRGDRRQPADAVPDVLGRRSRLDARPHGPRQGGRFGRSDSDSRLVVRHRSRLGQRDGAAVDRPEDHDQVRPRGRPATEVAARLAAGRRATDVRGTQLRHGRRPGPRFLRRLRNLDGYTAAELGRRRLVA